jgi:hypothetical protein
VGEVLDCLHFLEGFEEGVAVADGTVVSHEDGVVKGEEWGETFGYLTGSGGGVFGEGNYADGHDGFLTEHLFEAAAGTGEGCGDGWMGVDDGSDVVAMLVDGEMHAEFAGDFPGTLELPAAEIDDDHVGGCEEELAETGWGDDEALVIQTDGEIAGGAGHESQAVEEFAEVDDVSAQLSFGPVFVVCHVSHVSPFLLRLLGCDRGARGQSVWVRGRFGRAWETGVSSRRSGSLI